MLRSHFTPNFRYRSLIILASGAYFIQHAVTQIPISSGVINLGRCKKTSYLDNLFTTDI